MKKALFFFALLLSLSVTAQTQYYVSSSHNGESLGTYENPWKTIKEAGENAQSNSVINLKRGDVFYGTLTINANSVTINDYGDAELNKPKVSGLIDHDLSEDFERVDGNVYKYNLLIAPNVVMVDGELQELGRTPNSDAENGGYAALNYTVNGENSIVENSQLYAVGTKEVVIRTREYSIERNIIGTVSNNIVNFEVVPPLITGVPDHSRLYRDEDGVGTTEPMIGYSYFFQNGPATLDKDGEWYYDEVNKLLYVYFSLPPIGKKIRVSKHDISINVANHENINVENIDFEGANKIAIDMIDNKNFSASNCSFNCIGIRAIRSIRTKFYSVAYCNFSNCLSNAIQFTAPAPSQFTNDCTIQYCSFENIAPFTGMLYNNDRADGSAIHAALKERLYISNNSFNKIAKAAILFRANADIRNNSITNAVLSFADFGAIYTFYNPDEPNPVPFAGGVISNVISSCPGNILGTLTNTTPNKLRVSGIYIDGKSNGFYIAQNTIYNIGKSGITANDPNSITFLENTLIDNKNGILFTHRGKNTEMGVNVDVLANTFYSTTGEQINIYFEDQVLTGPNGIPINNEQLIEKINSFGWFEYNYYGLTNPIPFCVDITRTGQKFNFGFDAWQKIRSAQSPIDEISSVILPQRARYAPGGNSYKVFNDIEEVFLGSGTTFQNFARTSSPTNFLCEFFSESDGILIKFPTPWPEKFASIQKGFLDLPAGKYLLSYLTVGGSEFGISRAFFRDQEAIPNLLTPFHISTFNSVPKRHEFLIDLPATNTLKRLFVQIDGNSDNTFIDKITLTRVDAEFEPNSNFALFLPNPNNNLFPFTLDGEYVNKRGNLMNGTIDINPYDNQLLFKNDLVGNRPVSNYVEIPKKQIENIMPSFYPNPVTSFLRIENLESLDKWDYINVKSIDGKQTDIIQMINGKKSLTIDVSKLASGMYVAILLSKNRLPYTHKFYKK